MTAQDLIEKVKRYPVPAVCGAIVLVCFIAFYLRMNLLTDLEITQDDITRQADLVETNRVSGANLEEHLVQMRAQAAELESRIIRHSELANNLEYFYRLESETGVSLADLRQNPPAPPARGAPKTAFTGIGYSVVLSGSFAQAVAYVSELENGRCLYRLESFNLQRVKEGNQDTLSLALNLELLGWP